MKNRPETKQSLVARYNCGPVKLSGDSNAFYERHVAFDQVVAETETSARDKFEAIAGWRKHSAGWFLQKAPPVGR